VDGLDPHEHAAGRDGPLAKVGKVPLCRRLESNPRPFTLKIC
jgi:hypothetical protein